MDRLAPFLTTSAYPAELVRNLRSCVVRGSGFLGSEKSSLNHKLYVSHQDSGSSPTLRPCAEAGPRSKVSPAELPRRPCAAGSHGMVVGIEIACQVGILAMIELGTMRTRTFLATKPNPPTPKLISGPTRYGSGSRSPGKRPSMLALLPGMRNSEGTSLVVVCLFILVVRGHIYLAQRRSCRALSLPPHKCRERWLFLELKARAS